MNIKLRLKTMDQVFDDATQLMKVNLKSENLSKHITISSKPAHK